jgi:hypothetical protein
MSDARNLSCPHRDTLAQLFRHPTSHNIEWHDVLSLLEAVGSVEEADDGKYLVRIGSGSVVVERPVRKDIDTSTVVELRRVLGEAGFTPVPCA